MYYLTNMLAPLPARLANDGKSDTLLMVYIADDLESVGERVQRITLTISARGIVGGDRLPANRGG